jgi:hypothetical protein
MKGMPPMRRQKTPAEIVGTISYIAGYMFAIVTFVKLAWWIWAQPW